MPAPSPGRDLGWRGSARYEHAPDLLQGQAVEVGDLDRGAIANCDAQEREAPNIGLANEPVPVGPDQYRGVAEDLEEVGERGRRVPVEVDLHVGAVMPRVVQTALRGAVGLDN